MSATPAMTSRMPGRMPARKIAPPIVADPDDALAPAFLDDAGRALDRVGGTESLEGDHGDDEERRDGPCDVRQAADDRAHEAPRGVAQEGLQRGDGRPHDQHDRGPPEDDAEAAAGGGDGLGERRVGAVEGAGRACGERHRAELADDDEQVEAGDDERDGGPDRVRRGPRSRRRRRRRPLPRRARRRPRRRGTRAGSGRNGRRPSSSSSGPTPRPMRPTRTNLPSAHPLQQDEGPRCAGGPRVALRREPGAGYSFGAILARRVVRVAVAVQAQAHELHRADILQP